MQQQETPVALPFEDGAALTVHTIYFMTDPATTFAEIARALRPGGRLALACVVSDDGIEPWKRPPTSTEHQAASKSSNF